MVPCMPSYNLVRLEGGTADVSASKGRFKTCSSLLGWANEGAIKAMFYKYSDTLVWKTGHMN